MTIWPMFVTLGGTLFVQLIVAVYVYGRLTEKVSGQGKDIQRHETRLDDHEHRLRMVETGDALSQLAEWVRETHGKREF